MRKVINIFREYPLDVAIDSYIVGKSNHRGLCLSIQCHEPRFEGEQYYCDVAFEDGKTLRIFRPDSIEFVEVEGNDD